MVFYTSNHHLLTEVIQLGFFCQVCLFVFSQKLYSYFLNKKNSHKTEMSDTLLPNKIKVDSNVNKYKVVF